MQTEVEFLEDLLALLCETKDKGLDPWEAIKTATEEIADRITDLEEAG